MQKKKLALKCLMGVPVRPEVAQYCIMNMKLSCCLNLGLYGFKLWSSFEGFWRMHGKGRDRRMGKLRAKFGSLEIQIISNF
jgi:hypothetical protein